MGAKESKTTPQEALLATYQQRHETAEEANKQAHDVLAEFKKAIEDSGYTDEKVCDRLAIIYAQRLRQFEPRELHKLGLMLGLMADDEAFGGGTSYKEVVDGVCQEIIAFYKRKVDVLTYLLQQTDFCLKKSKEVAELFDQTQALTLDKDGSLPFDPQTYKLAVDLDKQVIEQYQRLRDLASALVLDQTLTSEELEALFAKTKKVVEASNAVCGARAAVIESQLPKEQAAAQ